jgi:hypothetical protein
MHTPQRGDRRGWLQPHHLGRVAPLAAFALLPAQWHG